MDKILDQRLIVVVPSLETLEMLVHFLLSQVGHDAGLPVRSPLDCVVDDPVQIGIDCSLVHLHDLFIEALLAGPNNILSISPTSLLDLPVSSLVLRALDLFLDLFLLCHSHQFLGKLVQSFSDYLALQPFVHSISEPVLMLLQQDVLGLVLREVGDLGDYQQLFNKGEPLLFPLIHDILLGSSSQNPLQE